MAGSHLLKREAIFELALGWEIEGRSCSAGGDIHILGVRDEA